MGPVVEDEVREVPPFDGHEDGFVGGVDGRDDPLFSGCQLDSFDRAGSDAQTAAEADVFIQPCRFFLPLRFSSFCNQFDGIDGADL